MEKREKIEFDRYGIEFDKKEFDNMNKQDLIECDKILKEIEQLVDKE